MINSQTIPAWFVGFMMLYTAFIWLITIHAKVRMDSRIIAYTLIIEGLIYGVIFQFFNLGLEVRGFFSRLMMLIICLSQALPLTISYVRSLNRANQ